MTYGFIGNDKIGLNQLNITDFCNADSQTKESSKKVYDNLVKRFELDIEETKKLLEKQKNELELIRNFNSETELFEINSEYPSQIFITYHYNRKGNL